MPVLERMLENLPERVHVIDPPCTAPRRRSDIARDGFASEWISEACQEQYMSSATEWAESKPDEFWATTTTFEPSRAASVIVE